MTPEIEKYRESMHAPAPPVLTVLLLSPPVFDYYFTPARKEPLGLLYIKSALDRIAGISVDLYDATVSGTSKKTSPPESFAHLSRIYAADRAPFSLFSHYYRFGDSFDVILDRIHRGAYDLVGISALFSAYFPDVEALVRRIKSETAATVAVGGWAVEAEGEALFAESAADIFVCGNGEETFPALVTALLRCVPLDTVRGIIFRKNGVVHATLRGAPQPIPEWFPRRTHCYRFNNRRIARVVISRGCAYRCEFCAVHRRRDFSVRSIESIDRELAYLAGIGVEVVDFEDDNLFHSVAFADACIPVLEKYHRRGMRYAAMNGMTAANIVPIVNRLIPAGFIELNLSLVTSDTMLSRSVGRPLSLDAVNAVVDQVRGRVRTLVFLILGLPGSTPAQARDDILLLARLPVIIGVSPLYAVPGLPLFDAAGLPPDRRLLRGSALYRFGDAFTREDVASLWKFARMINWLKERDALLSAGEREACAWFGKSLREKTWYRKTRGNRWLQSFSFSVDLPGQFLLCTVKGELRSVDFRSG